MAPAGPLFDSGTTVGDRAFGEARSGLDRGSAIGMVFRRE